MFCVNFILFDPTVLEMFHIKHIILSPNFITEIFTEITWLGYILKLGSILVQINQCVAEQPKAVISSVALRWQRQLR